MTEIEKILRSSKIKHSTESEMQDDIERLLSKSGIEYQREFRFSPKDRVDFLVEGIAIECKTAGNPMRVHRQIERYAKYDEVKSIILITSKFMKVKPEINGKPASVIHAGAAWI